MQFLTHFIGKVIDVGNVQVRVGFSLVCGGLVLTHLVDTQTLRSLMYVLNHLIIMCSI